MATLLHVESSPRFGGSVSRRLGADFVARWREANPDGEVVVRDLGAAPPPHVDEAEATHFLYSMGQSDPEGSETVRLARELIEEIKGADVVLIGAPMYNFTVTSGLKAYFDHVVWPGQTIDPSEGKGMLTDKRAFVIATRSGGYGPGTPREEYNFVDPYLEKLLGFVGITDVEFVKAELTLFTGESDFGMPQLRELGLESMADAEKRVRELASGLDRPSPISWGAPEGGAG